MYYSTFEKSSSMKSHVFLFVFFVMISSAMAQDTLYFENFESETLDYIFEDIPSGTVGDIYAYNYDEDQLMDGSPSNRPGVWFLAWGFADVDSTNTVLAANSWTNTTDPVKNWFITPAIQITDGPSAVLSWKSAPYQTPYYCDGYKVLISTTTNDPQSFTDTVFVAAEYLSGPFTNGGNYSLYSFSAGFVHGMDGMYVEFNPDGDGDPGTDSPGDTARLTGVLRPFSVSLAAYHYQLIYVAFLHETVDDNLISIDDILVTETTDIYFSTQDLSNEKVLSVYPNPASDYVMIAWDIADVEPKQITCFDQSGRKVYEQLSSQYLRMPVHSLSNGIYLFRISDSTGHSVKKLIVAH